MRVQWGVSFLSRSASVGNLRTNAAQFRALAASVLALSCFCSVGHAHQQVAFTVQHSVEWTRIVSVGEWRSVQPPDVVLFSPDRAQFLVRTRRGDVGRNVNVERILAFDVAAVTTYLSSSGALPPPAKVLAEALVQHDSNELKSVRWVDNRRVAFLAEGDDGVLQVFVTDLGSGSARQVTSARHGVASFAIIGDTLVFYAYRDAVDTLVQPISDQFIYTVITPPEPTSEAVELFESSLSSGVVRRIDLPPARIFPQYQEIWLSPSGRYAMVLAPALSVPSHWTEYRAGAEESRYLRDAAVVESDSFPAMYSQKLRYVVVDRERRETRPLVDAPSGSIARTFGPTAVHWRDDERSVVVSHTYLPLDVSDDEERLRRAGGPAVAEVDLQSGKGTAIAWEPRAGSLANGDWTGLILSVEWDPDSAAVHVQRQTKAGAPTHEYFRKTKNRWQQIAARPGSSQASLSVEVRQSLNKRPQLYARTAGVAKVLLDPNPHADGFSFGRVEEFSWTDDNNLRWRGGLIYPTGYVAGRKYPFVLQTHGYSPDLFLLDGPSEDSGTAFAAQALANAGFIVLQAGEIAAAVTNDERESRLVAQGWRAAIRELIARGLVDPEKIGIVAFSRTCMHAIRFLADYPDIAGAATLADGPWWGYSSRVLLTNYPKSTVEDVLRTTGGKPELQHLQSWFDAQPLYQLPNSRAAIRLEAMGPISVVSLWETLAVLQNAARPVDMIYFPKGGHNLMKPVERVGSQQGNVDWFRFWLKDEADADPRKAVQYERWRRLRDRSARDR